MKSPRLLVLLLALPLGCQSSPSNAPAMLEPPVDNVLKLMDERLALMHDVAVHKTTLNLPTADATREEAILQAVEVDAKGANVDKAFAREFFAAQFAAAKLEQEAVRARIDMPPPTDEDMKAAGKKLEEVRTKINDVSEKLLRALGKIDWANRDAEARKLFAERGPPALERYAEAVRAKALGPVMPR